MTHNPLQLPQHQGIRRFLRIAGPILLLTGLGLTGIGMGSVFMSMGSFAPPRWFWCAFLGMPLMFAGGAMCLFGFLGAIARYQAAETAPVASDTINYVGEHAQPGVKAISKAVAEGFAEGRKQE